MSPSSSSARRRKPASGMPAVAGLSPAPPTSSRLVPTTAELVLLGVFPLTLALGSLYGALSPASRAAPYSPELQAHPAALAPSYFATKNNVLNRYFVKLGWGWVSVAFAAYTASNAIHRLYGRPASSSPASSDPRSSPPSSNLRSSSAPSTAQASHSALLRHLLQPALRWALLTAWWFGVTQAFFGPALIDRGFRWTGGRCELVLADGVGEARDPEVLGSAATCRRVGGAWRGGHDISGHAFLLVSGCALLGFEVLPGVLRRRQRGEAAPREAPGVLLRWAEYLVAVIAGAGWWMLLMTAVYFHTWFEKVRAWMVRMRRRADPAPADRPAHGVRRHCCRLLPAACRAQPARSPGCACAVARDPAALRSRLRPIHQPALTPRHGLCSSTLAALRESDCNCRSSAVHVCDPLRSTRPPLTLPGSNQSQFASGIYPTEALCSVAWGRSWHRLGRDSGRNASNQDCRLGKFENCTYDRGRLWPVKMSVGRNKAASMSAVMARASKLVLAAGHRADCGAWAIAWSQTSYRTPQSHPSVNGLRTDVRTDQPLIVSEQNQPSL